MEAEDSSVAPILSRQTLVPLGVVLTLGGGVVYALLESVVAFQSLEYAVTNNTKATVQLQSDIERMDDERVDLALKIAGLEQWVTRLHDLNPDLRLPPLPGR